ncbi:hypothetical protein BH18GEM1_BH18GEM1_00480 [soil metagenome]
MPEHVDAETVYALLDGRLDTVRSRQVETHLWRCEACRRLRAECGALRTSLLWYGAEPPSPPDGYWNEFWRRVSLDREPDTRPAVAPQATARRLAPLLAAAASVVLIVGGVWAIRAGTAMAPTPAPAQAPASSAAQAEWADDYELFERTSIAIGGVDPMSKGVVLASLAEAP